MKLTSGRLPRTQSSGARHRASCGVTSPPEIITWNPSRKGFVENTFEAAGGCLV